MLNHFQDKTFALLTLHGKEKIIEPIFLEQLQVKIQLTQAFDTDSLGTFSGETERLLSPVDCAKKKAELASSLTGYPIGLGSEGSFHAGPFGLVTFNEELVACVDSENQWTVIGRSYQPCPVREQECRNADELEKFINQTPLNQGLILKVHDYISKGLYEGTAIYQQLQQWFGDATKWPVTISYDLRAHHCPERRERIAKATQNLVERLLSACPNCKRPGFWPDEVRIGLACSSCGTPTNTVKQRIALCQYCTHQQLIENEEKFADPSSCPSCNP